MITFNQQIQAIVNQFQLETHAYSQKNQEKRTLHEHIAQ
jgi:hypothetical protein